jgi:DNA (cytosine-5)-methyltransferase 1
VASVVRCVDLYCGAGGTSGGFVDAMELLGLKFKILAINHSPVAIASHAANHPYAEHVLANVEGTDPAYAEFALGGKTDVLVATASCTHFSNARGGKPWSEQQRYGPWAILTWVKALRPIKFVIENV